MPPSNDDSPKKEETQAVEVLKGPYKQYRSKYEDIYKDGNKKFYYNVNGERESLFSFLSPF